MESNNVNGLLIQHEDLFRLDSERVKIKKYQKNVPLLKMCFDSSLALQYNFRFQFSSLNFTIFTTSVLGKHFMMM